MNEYTRNSDITMFCVCSSLIQDGCYFCSFCHPFILIENILILSKTLKILVYNVIANQGGSKVLAWNNQKL